MPQRAGPGRPPKYDPNVHPKLARWMARSGLIDKEMAREMGISKSTLNLWKKEHPEFFEAMTESKNLADARVEDSLFKRALGYDIEETEVTAVPNPKQGKEEQPAKPAQSRVKRVKKHVAADVTACIFWLKNRQPARWRDKVDHEHSGPGGTPIPLEASVELKNLDIEELRQLEAILVKATSQTGGSADGAGGEKPQ